MAEVDRIVDQLERAYKGEAWHGPSVTEVLKDVTPAQAAAKPLPKAHSIWEIVLHIAGWKNAASRRLEGKAQRDPPEGDWPAVGATDEAAWKELLAYLERRHRELVDITSQLGDDRLDRPTCEGFSKAYVLLHGMAHHDLYHAGQIAILKKA